VSVLYTELLYAIIPTLFLHFQSLFLAIS